MPSLASQSSIQLRNRPRHLLLIVLYVFLRVHTPQNSTTSHHIYDEPTAVRLSGQVQAVKPRMPGVRGLSVWAGRLVERRHYWTPTGPLSRMREHKFFRTAGIAITVRILQVKSEKVGAAGRRQRTSELCEQKRLTETSRLETTG
eukprot:scaffold166034_cov25-Prasinocladus_malaysianus.AAC.1